MRNNKRVIPMAYFRIVAFLIFSGTTFAQTQVPYEFRAGEPARASEVNENFLVLESGVNANAMAIPEMLISPGQATVLDFTDPDQCIIDRSGNYVLNRNWDFSPVDPEGACTSGVRIETDTVLLDLQGYQIICDLCGGVALSADSDTKGITVRNGSIKGSYVGQYRTTDLALRLYDGGIQDLIVEGDVSVGAWDSEDHVTVLNLSATGALQINPGAENMYQAHGAVSVSKSVIEGRISASSSGRVVIRNSRLYSAYFDDTTTTFLDNTITNRVWLSDVTATVIGNYLVAGMELNSSSGGFVIRNIIGSSSGPTISHGILVSSFAASHGGAVIDRNIVRNAEVGIEFRDSFGNFFGNNRVSATIPFIGTQDQTDWGGNVGY
jgi:hypothetical protein